MAKHGIDKANLDLSSDPRKDFYQYACGGWIKEHPMKGEHSSFGMFDFLRDNAREQLKDLITTLGANPDASVPGTIAQKVNDVYNQVLDTERLTREGVEPIMHVIRKVEEFRKEELTQNLIWLHKGYADSFFGAGVVVDAKNSDAHIFCLGEAGLSLGDRDYYLEENETNAKIMAGFQEYVKKIMQLARFSATDAERIWKAVIKVETEIARHKHTREQRRDPNLRYNVFPVEEIRRRYPFVDWQAYFEGLGVNPDKVDVSNPEFIDFAGTLIESLSEREIKDYILYDVVSSASGLLGEDFDDANFEFFSRIMSGIEEKKPRWKKAMALTNSIFGEAIGKLYVEKYFPEENKDYMKALVENLRSALADHIEYLEWMGPDTKVKALDKLKALTVKIGYPDKWKDYSGISIDPEKSLWENVFNASLWFINDNLSKLGKPVDKEEWHMYPQTVNAYYSPVNNEICFPAAILQPPYFDITADDALNYGAIGVVIGHETTHGFDDQGRQFDKDGNLKNWWSEVDEERFKAISDRLVALFDAVEVAPGVHANGRFTLGENIADQGGLRIALSAYRKATEGQPATDIDGLSPLQRFYLAYAQVWAGSIRDEEVLVRTKSDPHSLSKNRVNETLKNIAEFFEAFGIKEGDPMFRPESERVIIW
ncbi:MAG: M13 family metallopeptidase [Muribaculaceae bacterium]|nr:M13 family metallopeptidase [Muribaculaceae bacterium]